MMQNYSKNPKPARNETKFNNTKKWRNRLDYTTFLIDSYFYLSLFLENYLTSSKSASWISSALLPLACWPPAC
jgi:hypothetical protein